MVIIHGFYGFIGTNDFFSWGAQPFVGQVPNAMPRPNGEWDQCPGWCLTSESQLGWWHSHMKYMESHKKMYISGYIWLNSNNISRYIKDYISVNPDYKNVPNMFQTTNQMSVSIEWHISLHKSCIQEGIPGFHQWNVPKMRLLGGRPQLDWPFGHQCFGVAEHDLVVFHTLGRLTF